MKKMNAKPIQSATPSLDDFIGGADPISEAQKQPSEKAKAEKRPKPPTRTKKSVGKPPMAPEDVRNQRVQVTLTTSELEDVKSRAGRVPVSTYLRDEMKAKGII